MTVLRKKTAFAGLLLAFSASLAAAQGVNLPDEAPLPEPRPFAPLDKAATTAAVAFGLLKAGSELEILREGLDALSEGDLNAARQARDNLAAGSLDRRILAWAIAYSGNVGVSSAEIARTASSLAGWPGMARLSANSERALYREKPPAREVVAAFGDMRPVTYEGTLALARAHVALADREAARAVISPFWRTEKLDGREESLILEEFGDILEATDHRYRMERMLYEDRIRSAERVAARAGGEALAKAWAAVIRGQRDAGKLLDAVPKAQRTAGYHFAKARYLRRKGAFREAAEAMLSAPREEAALIDPDEWWVERRVLSRELMDIGEMETAYRIAARHEGGGPVSRVEAAFHAGWYALRALKDANGAAAHFEEIIEVADGPISRARGFYWLGRAAEAGGPGEASDFYEQAAAFGTTFYGQLAAAKLGRTTIDVALPEPTDFEQKRFAAREAVRAIRRLEEAGHEHRAAILYLDLAREISSPGELALLAAMADGRGEHYLALKVGKAAALRGLEIGTLAHPVGAIPSSASISGAGKALAYAIARQESEFNAGAVSHAGARGLLQLMPATAKAMAKKSGLPYSAPRLTSDAGYNATLGAAYLSEQLSRFDGSYVLTFVGYNAGPRRAAEWIERYGDPRGKPIDEVVDWIERIPFTETRYYVQRVMENYEVYKMRLTGRFDIEKDLVEGR